MDDRRGHERRDFPVRGVVLFAVFLVLSAAVIHVALGGLYAGLVERRGPRPPSRGERPAPPPPRLQADPAGDLRRHRAFERAMLEGYGIVDRAAGVFRIPIERAMDLVAERGLPVRPEEER